MKKWRFAIISAAVVLAIGLSVVPTGALGKVAPKDRDRPDELVRDRIDGLRVGKAQHYGGLTVFPVIGRSTGGLDYLTLDEAMDKGLISVREKGSGEVNTIVITNKSRRRVFIMDGEEIIGAKQNRIVNSSVMIGPRSTVYMPVSCVEHGRWTSGPSAFKSGGTQLFPSARQKNVARVSANYEAAPSAGPQSDQSMIWDVVGEQRAKVGLSGGSGAMHESYTAQSWQIERYMKEFRVISGQVGAVFAIQGRIVGADIFDQHRTLVELLPKLIKSYSLDAISEGEPISLRREAPRPEDAKRFLRLVLGSGVSIRDYNSPGEGRDVRISSRHIDGAGLVVSGRAVHIALFAKKDIRPITLHESGGIASPSQRRDNLR